MRMLIASIFLIGFFACKKAIIQPTVSKAFIIPWNDTSTRHPLHAQLQGLIEKYRKQGLPGIALLVNDPRGTWIGSAGKADIEKDVPFGVGQVSQVASVTKLFMGALVFRLMEDSVNTGIGYRALHQPINTWLPRHITDKLANGNTITLGDCMNHETGVPDLIEQEHFYLAVLNNPNKLWKARELIEFVYNKPALFAPKDTAIYSNTNTLLVAMVLDAATGKNHGDLMRQYLFQPLGLKNTYYHPHDKMPADMAQGYFDLYNNGKIVNVSNLIIGDGNGYNGVFSNVFDLYTFIQALLVQRTLLTSKSLSMMHTFGKADFPNQYGYGIMKKFIDRGINAGIGHSGRELGYTANLFHFPNKKVTHAFVINYGTDSDSRLKKVFEQFQEELLNLTLQ
ncbi:MAG TPA: serine hydrolase [Flavisolibacter sp.]|nr:serine hydrolase [Flavisolibacter sp.]